MKNLISNQTELNLLKLGLYQIIGGAGGIVIILWLIYKSPSFTIPAIFLYILVLAFFLYSIFCGILCMTVKKYALTHSLVNQMFQLIGFTFFGFAFYYVAGIYIRVGIEITPSIKFDFDFDFGVSNFSLSSVSNPDKFIIDINFVALGLIIWIDKLRIKVKEELQLRKMSSIISTIGK